MGSYILVIDEGTTSVRAIIFDLNFEAVVVSQKNFSQIFPYPGWVEHDAEEIYQKVKETINEAILKSKIKKEEIKGIGITNQRETIVPFKSDGTPLYNAIVWQCRRTSSMISNLKSEGLEDLIHSRTGLFLDPYFSASKIRWLTQNVESVKEAQKNGELLFGTIDSYILYRLTSGKIFATDVSNASRTMLFNINDLKWDEEILKIFKVEPQNLPKVLESSRFFGEASDPDVLKGVPVLSIIGDQQAALFGQGCINENDAKNTYGTGCFLLVNTGSKPVFFKKGILTTIGFKIGSRITYAAEGSIFTAGALLDWLKDNLGILKDYKEISDSFKTAKDNDSVFFVPAFSGLGAPYWDPYARGGIFGLTRKTTASDIIRAASESIAYQTDDLIRTLKENGINLKEFFVDGGISENESIMQFQADISNIKILKPSFKEATAKGAAILAGITASLISSSKIKDLIKVEKEFLPQMKTEEREKLYSKWQEAVKRVRNWEE